MISTGCSRAPRLRRLLLGPALTLLAATSFLGAPAAAGSTEPGSETTSTVAGADGSGDTDVVDTTLPDDPDADVVDTTLPDDSVVSTAPATETSVLPPESTEPADTTAPATTDSPVATVADTLMLAPMSVALLAEPAPTRPPVPAPTCWTDVAPVQLGTRGDPARCVETQLVAIGYWLRQGPDGLIDDWSAHVIGLFQQRQGLPATGIADIETLQELRVWKDPIARPAPTCSVQVIVVEGMAGAPADCVEARLKQWGYWLVGPDDRFDATGVNALRAFQRRQGMADTGVADRATLVELDIWRDPPARPLRPCATPYAVALGDVGYPARCVETRLVQLGYGLSGPDDSFDATAASAVRSFQRGAGLPVTGVVDFQTLYQLGLWAPKNDPAATCRTHGPVHPGDTSTGSTCVKTRLQQLGYAVGASGDFFDETAVASLRSYQYRNGLPALGVADRSTLNRMGIWNPVSPNPFPVPANSGTGRRIVYSLAQQRIWVVEADGTVVRTTQVSGRPGVPRRGQYSVYSRSLHTYASGNPSVRWRYMIRFTHGPNGGAIGFHEIPKKNGVPLQSYSQLGQALSAGCVRMTTADAQFLWSWAPVGTKVVVI